MWNDLFLCKCNASTIHTIFICTQLLLHRSKYKGRRGCIFFVYKGLQQLCCLSVYFGSVSFRKELLCFRHFFLVIGAPS